MTKVLSKVTVLSMLRFDQLQLLRDHMKEVKFDEGQYLMRQGEPGDFFYVLLRGSATVRRSREEGGPEEDIALLSGNMCFGEQAPPPPPLLATPPPLAGGGSACGGGCCLVASRTGCLVQSLVPSRARRCSPCRAATSTRWC